MPAFHDYVRGRTDEVPAGYDVDGMRVYRHLVYLGAAQAVEAHFPAMRHELGEADWRALIEAFVRQSRWTSHYYGDLKDEFLAFLAREAA
ncbi:MAG: DNA-binding domain-containing protein [Aquabacterium sp.]